MKKKNLYIIFIILFSLFFNNAYTLAPTHNNLLFNILFENDDKWNDFKPETKTVSLESTDGEDLPNIPASCYLTKREQPCLNCILSATILKTNSQASTPYKLILPHLNKSLNFDITPIHTLEVNQFRIDFYEYDECIVICQPCMVCPIGPFSKSHPDNHSLYSGLNHLNSDNQKFSDYLVHQGFNKQHQLIFPKLRAQLCSLLMEKEERLKKIIILEGQSRGGLLAMQVGLNLLLDKLWVEKFNNPIGLILFSSMRSINDIAYNFLKKHTAFFVHITHYGDPANFPPFSPEILDKIDSIETTTKKEKNRKAIQELKTTTKKCYEKGLADDKNQSHYIGTRILLLGPDKSIFSDSESDLDPCSPTRIQLLSQFVNDKGKHLRSLKKNPHFTWTYQHLFCAYTHPDNKAFLDYLSNCIQSHTHPLSIPSKSLLPNPMQTLELNTLYPPSEQELTSPPLELYLNEQENQIEEEENEQQITLYQEQNSLLQLQIQKQKNEYQEKNLLLQQLLQEQKNEYQEKNLLLQQLLQEQKNDARKEVIEHQKAMTNLQKKVIEYQENIELLKQIQKQKNEDDQQIVLCQEQIKLLREQLKIQKDQSMKKLMQYQINISQLQQQLNNSTQKKISNLLFKNSPLSIRKNKIPCHT